jgi:hypothetical protein
MADPDQDDSRKFFQDYIFLFVIPATILLKPFNHGWFGAASRKILNQRIQKQCFSRGNKSSEIFVKSHNFGPVGTSMLCSNHLEGELEEFLDPDPSTYYNLIWINVNLDPYHHVRRHFKI